MTYPENSVLVVGHASANGDLPDSITELCGAASLIGTPVVLLICPSEINETTTQDLAQAGAEHVAVAVQDYSELGSSIDALEKAFSEFSPVATICSADTEGNDLAGRAAVRLHRALLSDAIGIAKDDEGIIAYHSVLGGSFQVTSAATFKSPVITLRPGCVEHRAAPGAGNIINLEVTSSTPTSTIIESTPIERSAHRPALRSAKTVVAGGRAFDSKESFQIVEDLADAFGGSLGASRAAVDAGCADRAAQVGQAGATIQPELYLALGISGAPHHITGMQSSKHIIAVNNDEEAPIFDIADFGVVGDVYQVVPKLTSLLAQRKG